MFLKSSILGAFWGLLYAHYIYIAGQSVSVKLLASLKTQFEHEPAYKDLLSVRVDILKEVTA